MSRVYRHHEEARAIVPAKPADVFDRLDDQARLGAHMEKSSAMMMGGRMHYEFDAQKGRALGSVIAMRGEMMGLRLDVEEVITERRPPDAKAWETRGTPHLLIIDHYRMGFRIAEAPAGAELVVFIDYNWSRGLGAVLAALFARAYARWCVERMVKDAAAAFRPANAAAA